MLLKAFCDHEEVQENLEENFDFDSDDSMRDPNYETLEHNTSSETEFDEEELNSMGAQLEFNMVSRSQTKCVNSKKISQSKRNKGESYMNVNGLVVPGRKFKPLTSDCRNKCEEKIPSSIQQQYFNTYWALGTYNQRILFIGTLMDVVDKKTQTLQKHVNSRNRIHTIKYYLECEGKKSQVCQKCFRQCFDETESYIKTVIKKKLEQPTTEFRDHRGSGAGTNKIPENVAQIVRDHINSFPAYESHYTRRDTSCKYFHADLTLKQMHKLYCDKHETNTVSQTKYYQIFKGKFKIYFYWILLNFFYFF